MREYHHFAALNEVVDLVNDHHVIRWMVDGELEYAGIRLKPPEPLVSLGITKVAELELGDP